MEQRYELSFWVAVLGGIVTVLPLVQFLVSFVICWTERTQCLATSAHVCCEEVTHSKKRKVIYILMNEMFKCLFEIDLFWLPITETVVLLSFFLNG